MSSASFRFFHITFTLALALALTLSAFARAHSTVLASPAGPDSGESNLFTAPDGTSYLTWCEPSGDREATRALRFATLAPNSATWSDPRTIVRTSLLMENWADFPSLVVGTDGTLWAQWFQKSADETVPGYSGWLARSTDEGRTWTPPTPLGSEFVSLTPLSGGKVLSVWLESTRPNLHAHAPAIPGAPTMKLSSRLLGPDGKNLGEWTVDPDVCTCCQTTLTTIKGDRAFVAYRGHTPGEIRDNHYAHFDGEQWSAPRVLHADGWQISGCPVNGPAADASGKSLAVAWFTAARGEARVFAKYSADAGATFGSAVRIDQGQPMGRVDLVMLSDHSALITWMETATGTQSAAIYARRLFPDGRLTAPLLVADSSEHRASGFPRTVTHGGGETVLITWTEPATESRVRVKKFSAPHADTTKLIWPDLPSAAMNPAPHHHPQ